MDALGRQPAFGVQSGHATGSSRSNRLTIITVRHITGREHSLDAGIRPERLRVHHVTLVICLDLTLEEVRIG